MENNLSKEFSDYLESVFNRRIKERLETESVPDGMRTLLEKEGTLITHEAVTTDKNASSIEELIELLINKYWNGIIQDFEKAA